MPPKPKFTREEIVNAAFDLVEKDGLEALTSRELGFKLGSSARPIFTVFRDMNELKDEVRKKARELLMEYLKEADKYRPLFKQAVKETIRFAVDHPHLFNLLFMSKADKVVGFQDLAEEYKDITDRYLIRLEEDYQLTAAEVMKVFKHTCVYIYGIGSMCASGICTFTDEQLNDTLGEVFVAMLEYIKSGRINEKTAIPVEVS